jgi:hypothetical protein
VGNNRIKFKGRQASVDDEHSEQSSAVTCISGPGTTEELTSIKMQMK